MQGTWENGQFVLAATKDSQIERLRAELAACMVLLDQAYKALKYHREQTRPIHETDEVIAAIDAARKGEGNNDF